MTRLVQYFKLSPMHCDSNIVLAVAHGRHEDRSRVCIEKMHPDASHQDWMFVPREGGFYEIVNKKSFKVLDDSTCGRPSGTVYQFGRHLGDNQLWKIRRSKTIDGVHLISKVNMHLAIDVGSWRKDYHAPIVIWHHTDQANQTWRMIRL
ncbi:MAG: RICIN domain-containing protein [Candidatus Moraniibacteriota bacterium]